MERAFYLLLSLFSAVMAALFLGAIAHYDLGIGREVIRTGALCGAALILAALTGGVVLLRRRWSIRLTDGVTRCRIFFHCHDA
jgi:hypothetical protein